MCAPVFLPPFSGEEKKHGATHRSPPTGTDRAGQGRLPTPRIAKEPALGPRPRQHRLGESEGSPHNRTFHARVSAESAKARGICGERAFFPAVFPKGSRRADLGRTSTLQPAHVKDIRSRH